MENESTQITIEALETRFTAFAKRHGWWSLGVLSFLESSMLPIITDPYLVALTLVHPGRWFNYTLLATATSVFGGLFGYLIGALFFDVIGAKLIAAYGAEDGFERTVMAFNDNAFLLVFLGAFTPIPYKLIAIVGGFLKINIFTFIIASIVGRFPRFLFVAYVTERFGETAMQKFKSHVAIGSTLIIAAAAAYLLITLR